MYTETISPLSKDGRGVLAISIPDSHTTGQVKVQTPASGARRRSKATIELQRHTNASTHTPIVRCSEIDVGAERAPLRYTPATCSPDNFLPSNGYTLQAASFEQPIELMVGITYYNESRSFLSETLKGVLENIRHITNVSTSQSWGPRNSASRKVVVSLLLDGYKHCDTEVLELLTTIGIFREELLRSKVGEKDTVAHIFERTCHITSSDLAPSTSTGARNHDHEQPTPVQLVVCLKERNSKKINSHRWLFNAFGRILNPNICVLLDAGTQPHPSALYKMWTAFHNDPDLGGACGEICVDMGWRQLLNPLVAVQNFEYKMSHIMDKSLESCVGYVSVLPGAFSTYRYQALQGEPLRRYLLGDQSSMSSSDTRQYTTVFHKNMFLAEDRVLGFEILAKAGAKWHLGYCWGCRATVDIPQDIVELLGQRRRWLNGAFAVFIYSILESPRLTQTKHSIPRLALLYLHMCYNISASLIGWFAPTIVFLVTAVIIKAQTDTVTATSPPHVSMVATVNKYLLGLYVWFLVFQIILALGSRPKDLRWLNTLSAVVFCLFSAYILALSLYSIQAMLQVFAAGSALSQDGGTALFANASLINGVVILAVIIGAPILCSICHLSAWHLVTSWLQYILFAPCFINLLMLHAFCNWHDVSWGTKGSDSTQTQDANHVLDRSPHSSSSAQTPVQPPARTPTQLGRFLARFSSSQQSSSSSVSATAAPQDQSELYRKLRTYLLLAWLLSNFTLAVLIGSWDISDELQPLEITTLRALGWIGTGFACIRTFGSLCYMLGFVVRKVTVAASSSSAAVDTGEYPLTSPAVVVGGRGVKSPVKEV